MFDKCMIDNIIDKSALCSSVFFIIIEHVIDQVLIDNLIDNFKNYNGTVLKSIRQFFEP